MCEQCQTPAEFSSLNTLGLVVGILKTKISSFFNLEK